MSERKRKMTLNDKGIELDYNGDPYVWHLKDILDIYSENRDLTIQIQSLHTVIEEQCAEIDRLKASLDKLNAELKELRQLATNATKDIESLMWVNYETN